MSIPRLLSYAYAKGDRAVSVVLRRGTERQTSIVAEAVSSLVTRRPSGRDRHAQRIGVRPARIEPQVEPIDAHRVAQLRLVKEHAALRRLDCLADRPSEAFDLRSETLSLLPFNAHGQRSPANAR